MVALTLVSAAALVVAGTSPGLAAASPRPLKPSAVTGLNATFSKPAGYQVSGTWTASTNATSYQTQLTSTTGTVLDSATVTATAWTAKAGTAPGTVTLSVTAYNAKFHSSAATVTVTLPDVTAPDGTFTTSHNGFTGTITQISLSDDSGSTAISRMVRWGDSSTPQNWTNATSISHGYLSTGARYLPTVTITDPSGNARVVSTPAIVVGDTAGPAGSFGTTPATGWATLTSVQVTQNSLADDYSPASTIARFVNWGDGSPVEGWAQGVALAHVYAGAGTFTPVVTMQDEAGNTSTAAARPVAVTVDAKAPVVTLVLPKTHLKHVYSWRTVKATVTDLAGTGVAGASVKAVEKRGSAWYAYLAASRTWVKKGTKAKALTSATYGAMTSAPRHRWVGTLAHLKVGTLVYKVTSVDKVGNRTSPVSHKAVLTRK